MNAVPEILLIDKPSGITSFDVIRQLRKILGVRKIGHAGTLDPLATGILLLGVGPGTKQLNDHIKLDKEYVAEIRLGQRTSTGDIDGEVIQEKPVPADAMTHEEVASAISLLVGTHTYVVSAYSAIKQGGVPMYKKARAAAARGETLSEEELPKREMTVYEAEVLDIKTQDGYVTITARFAVGSGTYIRSLAEAVGEKLGYPATIQSLRRTKVGEWTLADTITLGALAEQSDTATGGQQ